MHGLLDRPGAPAGSARTLKKTGKPGRAGNLFDTEGAGDTMKEVDPPRVVPVETLWPRLAPICRHPAERDLLRHGFARRFESWTHVLERARRETDHTERDG